MQITEPHTKHAESKILCFNNWPDDFGACGSWRTTNRELTFKNEDYIL